MKSKKPKDSQPPTSELYVMLFETVSSGIGQMFFQLLPAVIYYWVFYFVDWAPPYFPQGIAIIAIPVVAILCSCWAFDVPKDSNQRRKHATISVILAILIMSIYGVLLESATVVPPMDREGPRKQIGFGMYGLTESAVRKIEEWKHGETPKDVTTASELVNDYGLWGGECSVYEIWKGWTILLAGSLLWLVFVAGLASWSYGIAALASYVLFRNCNTCRTSGTP